LSNGTWNNNEGAALPPLPKGRGFRAENKMKILETFRSWSWVALAAVTAPGACGTVPPTPTPTPASYSCDTYCANALRLGCPFAQPAPGNGASCADVCRSATSVVRWDLACRSTSRTCDLVNACERSP
jgi:hypothetical protein